MATGAIKNSANVINQKRIVISRNRSVKMSIVKRDIQKHVDSTEGIGSIITTIANFHMKKANLKLLKILKVSN